MDQPANFNAVLVRFVRPGICSVHARTSQIRKFRLVGNAHMCSRRMLQMILTLGEFVKNDMI